MEDADGRSCLRGSEAFVAALASLVAVGAADLRRSGRTVAKGRPSPLHRLLVAFGPASVRPSRLAPVRACVARTTLPRVLRSARPAGSPVVTVGSVGGCRPACTGRVGLPNS